MFLDVLLLKEYQRRLKKKQNKTKKKQRKKQKKKRSEECHKSHFVAFNFASHGL